MLPSETAEPTTFRKSIPLEMAKAISKRFTYDAVYDEHTSQQQIFDGTAFEIVDAVMNGFNGTIFSYGQMGTGKSYTMIGPSNAPVEFQGILPRSFRQIFATIEANPGKADYLVSCSYLAIYQEELYDLISNEPKCKVSLRGTPTNRFFADGLSSLVASNVADMQQLLEMGLENLTAIGNSSHSIFSVTVEKRAKDEQGGSHILLGKLNVVDLAGFARESKHGPKSQQIRQITSVNLAEHALGNVIFALAGGKSYIPYRNSKLTALLKDSLGGNAKTVMIASIGAADANYEETLSTLRCAYRAKSVTNAPVVNRVQQDVMQLRSNYVAYDDGVCGVGIVQQDEGYVIVEGILRTPPSSAKQKRRSHHQRQRAKKWKEVFRSTHPHLPIDLLGYTGSSFFVVDASYLRIIRAGWCAVQSRARRTLSRHVPRGVRSCTMLHSRKFWTRALRCAAWARAFRCVVQTRAHRRTV